MEITGGFFGDGNFTYVFTGNRIYTIANNTGEWAYISVGDTTHWGMVLDENSYRKMAMLAEDTGTFNLKKEVF